MSTETKTELRLQACGSDGVWVTQDGYAYQDTTDGLERAQEKLESLTDTERYRVVRATTDVEPIEPPDPFTPGSVWYAKEGFTTRLQREIKRGSKWIVSERGLKFGLLLDEAPCTDGHEYCRYLPKDMLVAERPEPLVELPTGLTFGALTWKTGPNTADPDRLRTVTAEWYMTETISGPETRPERRVQMHAKDLGLQVPIRNVTAFTEAIAVPKAALDELRAGCERDDANGCNCASAAHDFLDDVDAAGEGK